MIEFINGLAATWASWALNISWQVAVLAAGRAKQQLTMPDAAKVCAYSCLTTK